MWGRQGRPTTVTAWYENRSSEFVKSALCVRATDFRNSASGYVRERCSFTDLKFEIKSWLKFDPITHQSHTNTNLISWGLIGIAAVSLFLLNSDYVLSRICFFFIILFVSLTEILSRSPAPRQCDYKRITLYNLLRLPSKHTTNKKQVSKSKTETSPKCTGSIRKSGK